MSEEQDKVTQAFEVLRKSLEEESERLNDPTVATLAQWFGNDPQLVEWMLDEVKRLEAIWREGKAPSLQETPHRRRSGKGSVAKRVFYGMPQLAFRTYILKALVELGGRGRGADVLARVEEMIKPNVSPTDLEWLPISRDYR